jgi:hypothetical protein
VTPVPGTAARRRAFGTVFERWEGLGPYYAMFPSWFADDVVQEFTQRGEVVLDPFAGRGTAIFSAIKADRHGIGAELSRVGWVYAKTKLEPATFDAVRRRLHEVAALVADVADQKAALPDFFRACYSDSVLDFLLHARDQLRWRFSKVDRTLMAHILVHLHGKRGWSLSNQMRQTKAMAPDYSLRWWEANHQTPPDLDPAPFLEQRLTWRYKYGRPPSGKGSVVLGDSTQQLLLLNQFLRARDLPPASLLLTSPPYHGVTNYHYDQWLRMWMLGGPPRPEWDSNRHRNRFQDGRSYKELLVRTLTHSRQLMKRDATLYVRTSSASDSLEPLLGALELLFPGHDLATHARDYKGPSQTQLFAGDRRPRLTEVDVVGTPRKARSRPMSAPSQTAASFG